MNNIEEIIKDMQAEIISVEDAQAAYIAVSTWDAKTIIQALQSAPKWLKYPENRPKRNGVYFIRTKFKQYEISSYSEGFCSSLVMEILEIK